MPENTEEMYIIIHNSSQLENLQSQGWKMPDHITNLGIGCIIQITRVKKEERDE